MHFATRSIQGAKSIEGSANLSYVSRAFTVLRATPVCTTLSENFKQKLYWRRSFVASADIPIRAPDAALTVFSDHLGNCAVLGNRWSAKATRAHQLDLFQGQEASMRMDKSLNFAGWVREQRQRLGLSQSALARRIGCRQPHLANVERGHDRLGEWPSRRLRELIEDAA